MKKLFLKIKSWIVTNLLNKLSLKEREELLANYYRSIPIKERFELLTSYSNEMEDFVYNNLWFKLFAKDDIWTMEQFQKYNKKWLKFMEDNKITFNNSYQSIKTASEWHKELRKELKKQGVEI